jgi:RNA polymerase sigma-70 factor (ECF subfamily)
LFSIGRPEPEATMAAVETTADLSTPAAFAGAFREHARAAFAAAVRVLGDAAAAEDVVQDVFLALWRDPQKFDAARGSLRTYVAMMARSRALDRVRTRAARETTVERLQRELDGGRRNEEPPEELVLRRDAVQRALRALGRLPASQREAVALRFAGGLSAREIALATGVPLGTAKSRLRLGLVKAREQFGLEAA